MNIAVTKIDSKGRITLPKFFLDANGVKNGTSVVIQAMYNNPNCCKLYFVAKETEDDK
jgi:bifunctional DNA-binding transcriptional regulator/antitoxin component of YhaV-PrlF toxin-antitoxin module